MNAPAAWEERTPSLFERLSKIDCSGHTEKKGKFTYLSWPWAVKMLRENDSTATWETEMFDGKPYCSTENGTFVKVSVTAGGVTLSQIHPVLDNNNRPIAAPNAFQINTSIQRCLVKAIALHGLGLYIYAGEDLPEVEKDEEEDAEDKKLKDEIAEGMKILNQFRENSLKGSAALKSFRSMCKGDVAKKVWAKHEASLLEAACKADEELAGAM